MGRWLRSVSGNKSADLHGAAFSLGYSFVALLLLGIPGLSQVRLLAQSATSLSRGRRSQGCV